MSVMSYIDSINAAMKEEMERDPRVLFSGKTSGEKAACLKPRRVSMNSSEKSG